MPFWKQSDDPWDRKPDKRPRPVPESPESQEPQGNFLDSLKAWSEDRKAKAKEKEEAKRLPPEKCPWCGKDMEQGYMMGGKGIFWYSGILTTKAAWIGTLGEERLRVDDEGLLATHKITWLCRDCKKMVLDMPEEDIWSMDRCRYEGPQAPEKTKEEEESEE